MTTQFQATTGNFVKPDGWGGNGSHLQVSGWDGCQFVLPSARYSNESYAVNVKVTGRTDVRGMVRVQLEFVKDGEPSSFQGGWMTASRAD